jgi:DNA-binding MarR family transcriptional regulator
MERMGDLQRVPQVEIGPRLCYKRPSPSKKGCAMNKPGWSTSPFIKTNTAKEESQKMGNYVSDLSADEKIIMALVRAAEQYKKESGAIFKKHGLTFSQYNALRVLDASTDGQNTITNVSRTMLVSGANMTGVAKRLEKNGFLYRKNDPNDERLTLLVISPKGHETLKRISSEKDRFVEGYLSMYTREEKAGFFSMLKKIIKKSSQQQQAA